MWIMHCLNQKIKQQTIRKTSKELNENRNSIYKLLNAITIVSKVMYLPLIEALKTLKPLELLDLIIFEDTHASNNVKCNRKLPIQI